MTSTPITLHDLDNLILTEMSSKELKRTINLIEMHMVEDSRRSIQYSEMIKEGDSQGIKSLKEMIMELDELTSKMKEMKGILNEREEQQR